MALCVVGDTISEIMGRMSSLPTFVDNNTTMAEKVNEHLSKIKGVVAAKLEENDTTRDWVGQVTDVVTDLFDFLEDLDLPADAALLQKQSMITSILSLFNLTPHSSLLKLKEIEKQLHDVAADATKLSLKNVEKLTNSGAEDREIQIVGRNSEKVELIKKILPEEKVEGAVPVVTIVGIQGIGKTKLAKFIYEDEKVKSDFDLMIWIDGIHEKFYAELVVKRMIELAMMKNDSVVMDENVNLGEALRGSRFFLVLDDLRNENPKEWLRLHHMLTEAATPRGGAVLITTQSGVVAQMVDSYLSDLEGLDEEESWSLFEQIAGGGPSDAKIIDAQKRMVKKCRGVPVAVLTMARLVRSREAITEPEINQLEEEFMQEMLLRYYNDLPSWHLKQCFAYCSLIFPRAHYSVESKKLIRLWMAEGFLGPINSSSPRKPELLGLECIREFSSRFFNTCENEYGILESCSMSDKPSAFVAGNDSLYMDDPDKEVKERVRRVSLSPDLDVSNGIPKSLFKNNAKLRTILLSGSSYMWKGEVKLSWSACDAIFSAFKRLRVLDLQDLGMKVLPGSIGELKSLRYLDLSHNNMKKLPNSIGELKHLQTLILSHCHQLKELPNEVNHLASLRHLETDACLHLTHMSSALKNLTWLQTLSHFVVSTGGLGGLIKLNNLRGELEILHLERLRFKGSELDKHAYLKEKQHLQCLTLRWNHDDEENESQENRNTEKHSPNDDEISLGHLQPHPDLQVLSIIGYKGNKFSDWLSSLQNLVGFCLYNCSTCKSLPLLDQLPKLKILKLQRLDSLESITTASFPSLKKLIISDCPNLTSWRKEKTDNNANPSSFTSLSTLQVKYCPKLDCMPLYPNLDEELFLECSSVKPLQETIITSRTSSDSDCSPPLSKLKILRIVNVEEQFFLPEGWLENFTSLRSLYIEKIESLKSLAKGLKHLSILEDLNITNCTELDLPSDEWEGLKNLDWLCIREIHKMTSLPEGTKHLTSLSILYIDSCPELTTLTEGIGELKSLKILWIEECHKLASLPQEMENLKSLNWLKIRKCPLLLPRCQKETGDDWPQIKHIAHFDVKDTLNYYD